MMKGRVQFFFLSVFFDANASSDEEKHNEGFCKKINDACQNKKRHRRCLKNIKRLDALGKNDKKHEKRDERQEVTDIHEKPHKRP